MSSGWVALHYYSPDGDTMVDCTFIHGIFTDKIKADKWLATMRAKPQPKERSRQRSYDLEEFELNEVME